MADQPRKVVYLSPSGPIIKEITDTYSPKESQSLIRVEYSGINPADIKHVYLGFHSSVAGYDLSGEVISVGPSSPFKVGDKVFGHNPAGPNRPLYHGAHQDFAIADSDAFSLVPLQRMSMSDAAVLPVVTRTAADGLFNVLSLAFPAAGLEGAEEQSILIWGAAGSVGMAALQLAKAAGHGPIFVTASTKNHPTLKALGADFCFDYKDKDVVVKIKEAISRSGKRLSHVLDAVGAGALTEGEEFERSTPAMAARCVSDEDAKFVCVLPVKGDARWSTCLAERLEGRPLFGPMGSKEWPGRIEKVMNWVTDNYGEGKFKIPNVRIVRGAQECVKAMGWSAQGQSSLEKIAVEHPL